MQEKKELKVGDWVRIRLDLLVTEPNAKYLGRVFKVVAVTLSNYVLVYTLSGGPKDYWYRSSLILVGDLSRLIEIRKENHEI